MSRCLLAVRKTIKLLGRAAVSLPPMNYSQTEKQAIEVAALSGTNITTFVNALYVFNDLLLDGLFAVDGE